MARVKTPEAHEDPARAARRERLARLSQVDTKLSADQLVELRSVYGEVYDEHKGWVMRLLARRGVRDSVADDAFQEILIGLFKALAAGFPRSVRRLLHVIAKRRIATLARARLNAPLSVPLPSSRSEAPGSDPDVDGALDRWEVPRRCVRRLRPAQREVVQRVVIEGQTPAEAARDLRIPEGTVKTRLRAAEASLRVLAREYRTESPRSSS